MYIFAADLSAAQRRSILGHKNFRDSDWSANNPQPSSEPIMGESCKLLGDMLLIQLEVQQKGSDNMQFSEMLYPFCEVFLF